MSHLPASVCKLCADFMRENGKERQRRDGGTALHSVCARLGERQPFTTISTCMRINDRGVKVSRTGRLRLSRLTQREPGRAVRDAYTCTTTPGEIQQHPATSSRDVKGKAGDSCLRHRVTFSPSAQKTQEPEGDTRGSKMSRVRTSVSIRHFCGFVSE